ncbi:MAG: hypothetical protein GDA36_10370 [Rhodobacteraceae bacterium]|nr:hypothetical protein [Paracoccaceae bacterium]
MPIIKMTALKSAWSKEEQATIGSTLIDGLAGIAKTSGTGEPIHRCSYAI